MNCKASWKSCQHLQSTTGCELIFLQVRFAHLLRLSAGSWGKTIEAFRVAPCATCGDMRLRRRHDALICLHCGNVGCWSPFSHEVDHQHGQRHLTIVGTHWLGAHVETGELYCGHCDDFVYDSRFNKWYTPV